MGLRKVKLIIENDLNDVPLVGIAVNRFCSYAAFSETEAFNIELCVIEAVTNSIKHAYGEKSGQEVMIIFTLSDNEAVFEICDKGKPMDPEKLKRADLVTAHVEKQNIDSIADSGRGLGIMKEIMDDVEYRSGNELNCLVLKKNIS
ncbi:MAG: ATP-binding protein [Deltaproteobacteria bacterium]|nr:ATP-binding protein [Deltaproteobacteria bacterium]